MKVFSELATIAKNSLSASYPFLIFFTIEHADIDTIRLVQNNEDVIYNGNLFTAFPVELDTIANDDGKTLPSVTLKVSNIHQIIQHEIQKYNGLTDAKVKIEVVYMEGMVKRKKEILRIDVEPEELFQFQVTGTAYDENWVSFTLGTSPAMAWRFPQEKYYADYCPFVFGDIRCCATGTKCQNTLSTCKNLVRFGGAPGLSGS